MPLISFCLSLCLYAAGASAGEIKSTATASAANAYPSPRNFREFKYHALVLGVDIDPGAVDYRALLDTKKRSSGNGSGSTCHVPFAGQLESFLTGLKCFANGSITVLKGGKALKDDIRGVITGLKLGPKDVLLIYYGGHGDLKGIMTGDTPSKSISPQELAGWMESSGAGTKVFLVSACYSGIFVSAGEANRGLQGPGFAVMTSGKERATSTYSGVGFGPYLWKLLNLNLKNPGDHITLGDLRDFVKKENSDWRKKNSSLRLSDGRNFGQEDLVLFWN
ncbi:MAG: C13 family peptidase [Elusimicrobiota bacterium]|nr:C13 family peptidase [Elusimicrobiota bacterium]